MNRSIQSIMIWVLSLILLAQIAYAPILLSVVFGIMIVRMLVRGIRQAKHKPEISPSGFAKALKIICVVIALAIIYFSYRSFIGVEAGTAILSVFLYAKALETYTKRDLIIFFNFALFVSASMFLYSQSMWMALMVLLCLLGCLVGLYRVQKAEFKQSQQSQLRAMKADLGHISKFVLLAVPIFIILFLFFPRFPPLWHIPISNQQAVTGISDRMSPGDIAELSQSSALAFRIIMDLKKLPTQNELYWRAMVLDQYDGKTWTRSPINQQIKTSDQSHQLEQDVAYEYLAADQRQTWITALEKSRPVEPRFILHDDDAITSIRPSQRNQPIQLIWQGEMSQQATLTANQNLVQLRLERQLDRLIDYPQNRDLKAQQLAQRLFEQSAGDPKRYIETVIRWYQQNHFVYTLKPGVLSEHRVDDFLLKTKQGFCEHYASSFVLLMRYAGLPARVVVGYQGGQAAPDRKSWEVRQLDAHAWAEVWLNGKWKRIDPTAIIAPQRIDLGMQDYIDQQHTVLGSEGYSSLNYQQFSLLKNLRIWSDYASFQWQNKVVGYDSDQQNKWMSRFGLNSDYRYAIILILIAVIFTGLYFMGRVYRHYTDQSKIQRIIGHFSNQVSVTEQKYEHETFQQWITRLDASSENDFLKDQLIQTYQKITYLDQKDKSTLNIFKKLLKDYAIVLKKHKKTCQ